MRIALLHLGREPDFNQQSVDAPRAVGRVRPDAERRHPFLDDFGHPHARVERRVGVLEYDLHLVAFGAQLGARQARQVLARKQHAPAGRFGEAQYAFAHGGLAAARLADQAERAPGGDRQRDAVDRLDVAGYALQHAASYREINLEVLDPQQRVGEE